jgi:FkbM family methyltransferase
MIVKTISNLRENLIEKTKNLIYAQRGEPYQVAGHTLHFVPGTRPVRVSYGNSDNSNVRYDALQVQTFSNELHEGDFAIDIGGHAGQYCLIMAAKCGLSGQVVTFEPDPYARKTLSKNLALNPQIKPPVLEPFAVSDKPGTAVLYSRGGNAQSSLARSGTEFEESHNAEEIEVKIVVLDEYLAQKKLPEPNWIKIDAEGAEINILRGAKKVLQGNTNIICEIHPYAWDEFGVTFEELQSLVAESGRRMRYLDEESEIGDRVEYGTVIIERIG